MKCSLLCVPRGREKEAKDFDETRSDFFSLGIFFFFVLDRTPFFSEIQSGTRALSFSGLFCGTRQEEIAIPWRRNGGKRNRLEHFGGSPFSFSLVLLSRLDDKKFAKINTRAESKHVSNALLTEGSLSSVSVVSFVYRDKRERTVSSIFFPLFF